VAVRELIIQMCF